MEKILHNVLKKDLPQSVRDNSQLLPHQIIYKTDSAETIYALAADDWLWRTS